MSLTVKQDQKYTYGDYETWPDDKRWEIIEGVPRVIPTPSRLHQEFVGELTRQLCNALKGTGWEGYLAPFDVRLPEGNEADELVETVVQPDLLVVCDLDKLDDKGCRGAPDWIIEIISPSTALIDLSCKHDLYEKHRVKEYWIVHPLEKWVMMDVFGRRRMI